MKKFIWVCFLILFFIGFCISSTSHAQNLPAGSIGTVNQTATNTYQLFSYSWTAPTTGADYVGIALRQDPGYWSVGSFKLTAQGSSTNLLSNGNLQYGGATNTQYGLQAPANWGLWYQSGNGAPPAAGMYYAPGTGWMGSTSLGLGVNTSTSGSWIDGAVGTYDGIYQGFSAVAGTTYNFSFYSAGTNSYSNPSIMIGVYAGACSSGTIFTCTPSNSAFTVEATPQETQGVGGAPAPTPPGPPPPAPTDIFRQGIVNGASVYATRIVPTSNNSPSAEQSPNAFDNNPNTKYLNFDKYNAGVTIQLNSGRVVSGFTLTTANDYPGRDPTSYKLYGSNDGTNWTLIQTDTLSLSDNRYWTSPTISVTNTNAYVYYYIFFPTTKAGDGCGQDCNSMQIAEITYIYDANNTTTSTNTGNGTVANPSSLCCGGSSAPFNANANYSNLINAFASRTTNDSQVYITQIGNDTKISVNQTGTKNNYAYVSSTGSSNNVTVDQSGTANTAVNYSYNIINGSSNTLSVTQTSTGGGKGAFVNVHDNNNTVTVSQTDSGSHYTDVTVSGGNKTVNVQQSGSASHMASVTLSGLPTSLSLQQTGATQNFYSIQFNCATAGGCSPISVRQGN